jgi:hypothetical protein
MAEGEKPSNKIEQTKQRNKLNDISKERGYNQLSQEEIRNINRFDAIWKKVFLEDKRNPQPISFYDEN